MVNPFNDIPAIVPTTSGSGTYYGKSQLDEVANIKIGSGTKAFKGDESGIWLGANKFEDALFRVGIDGVVRLKDEYGTSIIDAGGIVTDSVVGSDLMTKSFGTSTFSDTTPTKLTDTDLEVELRATTNVIVNIDFNAIKNDGAILFVILKIQKYNYGTSSYDAYTAKAVLQLETAGAFPWTESFSGLFSLTNTRGSGLPQLFNMFLEAYNSTGSSTLYEANIAYLKLNG